MEKKSRRKGAESGDAPRMYPLKGEQALQVLAILADTDEVFAKEISKVSARIYCHVSVEDVASSVYNALDGIAIEDCWDASGRQRGGGYRDEFDVAYDMVSDAFSPFLYQIGEFHQVGEHISEQTYLHGVLLGLYRFTFESHSDFFDYVEDFPESSAKDLIEDWKGRHADDTAGSRNLNSFLEDHCPDWQAKSIPFSDFAYKI
ncbi:MAG: hypothetical protein CVV46_10575 [Spirochaetae bacterium HGW-Spirochaetae-2]|nr:MAG: hypothetical protein CVV46_10575 [Spirochaetae bacterium HGW-Spirochaetae-2]